MERLYTVEYHVKLKGSFIMPAKYKAIASASSSSKIVAALLEKYPEDVHYLEIVSLIFLPDVTELMVLD